MLSIADPDTGAQSGKRSGRLQDDVPRLHARKDRNRFGVREDVGYFLLAQLRVQGHNRHTRAGERQINLLPFGAVLEHQRHVVLPRLDS